MSRMILPKIIRDITIMTTRSVESNYRFVLLFLPLGGHRIRQKEEGSIDRPELVLQVGRDFVEAAL